MQELSYPPNVHLIDQLVHYSVIGTNEQINESQQILSKFASTKNGIRSVYEILSKSSNQLTHLFAFNIIATTLHSKEFLYYPEQWKLKLYQSIERWYCAITQQMDNILTDKIIDIFTYSVILRKDVSVIRGVIQNGTIPTVFVLKTLLSFYYNDPQFFANASSDIATYSITHIQVFPVVVLKLLEKSMSNLTLQQVLNISQLVLPYLQAYERETLAMLSEAFSKIVLHTQAMKQVLVEQFEKFNYQFKPSIELANCLNSILPEVSAPPNLFNLMLTCFGTHGAMKYFKRYITSNPLTTTSHHYLLLQKVIQMIPEPPNGYFVVDDFGFFENVEVGGVGYGEYVELLVVLCETGCGERLIEILSSCLGADKKVNGALLTKTIWAISGVATKIPYKTEAFLFVKSLTYLLTLFSELPDTPLRTTIAKDVMMLVSKYPRFLKHKPQILEIVLKKIFEFCEDPRLEIEVIAVGTFVEIAKYCGEAIVKDPKCLNVIYRGHTSGSKLSGVLRGGFYDGLATISREFETNDPMYYDYIGVISEQGITGLKESKMYCQDDINEFGVMQILSHLITVCHLIPKCGNTNFPAFLTVVDLLKYYYIRISAIAKKESRSIEVTQPLMNLIISFLAMTVTRNEVRVVLIEVVFEDIKSIPLELICVPYIECCSQLIQFRNSEIIVEKVFNNVIATVMLSSSAELHDAVFDFIVSHYQYCNQHYNLIKDVILNMLVPKLLYGLQRDNMKACAALETLACYIKFDISIVQTVLLLVLHGKDYNSLLKVLLNFMEKSQVALVGANISVNLKVLQEEAIKVVSVLYDSAKQSLNSFTTTIISIQLV
ncbi:hypothetical protein EIN_053140 [Entamoeba invadens IP1]|uniref:hypothetical protein n=1 Tax=Entamoeba invadens IP1 TaxID=370355 RepID=UPI0002C3EA1F|nr:hypothetical protein EIN_053140 [Entamoeba invadens IP1]ELP93079.1 hypothetical protein EIN_053140 [Entamoeba invadens IP1]|eukprot:XP_004259850.1 hypothetical protein EIN_053140 [Entamoeba invadens IP1]